MQQHLLLVTDHVSHNQLPHTLSWHHMDQSKVHLHAQFLILEVQIAVAYVFGGIVCPRARGTSCPEQ